MARQPYPEDPKLHSLTTRQLRQYIADKADEAQKRLDTAPKDTTLAFDELKGEIINRSGKVVRSTSYMTKAEMLKHAYALRMFNEYDFESKYAERRDYQRNKKRYESFVRNQVAKSGSENQYWAQFITEKGNVSKKGYQEYKDFIAVLSASEDYLKAFGYRTIQQYAQNRNNNLDPGNKILSRVLGKVYRESKGKGLTQAELVNEFKRQYEDALDREQTKNAKAKPVKIPTKKAKKTSSKSNIKVKKAGKMRTSETVRNRQT